MKMAFMGALRNIKNAAQTNSGLLGDFMFFLCVGSLAVELKMKRKDLIALKEAIATQDLQMPTMPAANKQVKIV
jgi:hypothetical protein